MKAYSPKRQNITFWPFQMTGNVHNAHKISLLHVEHDKFLWVGDQQERGMRVHAHWLISEVHIISSNGLDVVKYKNLNQSPLNGFDRGVKKFISP